MADTAVSTEPRLTSLAHGGGCGCKIAPGVLAEILRGRTMLPVPPDLLVGIETADDAAVYRLNDRQAVVATTDFFMPIVDDPHDFGRIAASNALSDVYAMGGTPLFALALVGMPVNVLSTATIGAILDGGAEACARFIDALQMIFRLVNIGDAKSLACHPASTTHRQLGPEELAKAGVSEDLVRISVGIEHIDDIIADVDQALAKA